MRKRVVTNIISAGFGKFASKRFHPILQKFINSSYIKLLGLDMSEFKEARDYKSLNELFTRELIKKRDIDYQEDSIISPTDSLITECGKLKKDKSLQIKGMEYSIDSLLIECKENLNKIYDGDFINFYLSPKDYHRYHVPCDMQILKVIHVPGKLYPVNLRYLKKKINLFIENERVILECKNKEDRLFYIVLVGALNVGQMTLVFEKRVETNKNRELSIYKYNNLWMNKGELLGYFKMGSTVVMLFEKNSVKLDVRPGQNVKFGQKVAKWIKD
ncbi:phosphatidylserine decarboxylase [Nitrosophilus kaiyonis]|uniref:phosphatidylserine decarboxylase n=1 Tax=Nitrosophilus kaiyonis TaxID=2930200 RepID=UPI002492E134|nr:phosphatidylserine decarboxylase [Nitrosophilus kaiyonis]